ncbi:MAG: fumarylacetoacetate hydrolase family protein [Actinoplanes sp.]
MRLCAVKDGNQELAAAVFEDQVYTIAAINEAVGADFATDVLGVMRNDEAASLSQALADVHGKIESRTITEVSFAPPYRNPPKLWGFGPNYHRHARDLGTVPPPNGPGSWSRAVRNLIGPDDEIILPPQSNRVTAEAEIALVIGKECRNITPEEAPSVIFGYTTMLDMTAEDLLRENLRYVARAKGFDTFCSVGPFVVTADEITDLSSVTIRTQVNDDVIAESPVSSMVRDPYWLVSFHSQMTVLEVGDIIGTGTPGAGVITDGDLVRATVQGVGELRNRARAAR